MSEQQQQPTSLELLRIVTMREAAALSGLSAATLARRHPEKIIRLSPRRKGMRLRDALLLPTQS